MSSGFGRKDILNAVSGFLAAYGFVAFFCFFYLVDRWVEVAPSNPDPVNGIIFPHNEHGSITYFSAFQGTSCALLFWTSPLLFFVALFLTPKQNVQTQRGFLSIRTTWDKDDANGFQTIGMVFGAIAAPIIVFLLGPPLVTWLNSAGVVTGF